MGTKFGANYSGRKRKGNREHVMFIAAAGIAMSLFFVLIAVFSLQKADAKNSGNDGSVQAVSSDRGTVTLYTSNDFIRAGAPLNELAFQEVFWPSNSVPEGAVQARSEIGGMFARVDIPAGVPIQQSHLSREQSKRQNLPIVPGMRAVTIQVDEESGVAGWAAPGSRVDVALTYLAEEELTSKVIVQNARVLSKGGDASDEGELPLKKRAVKVAATITLEVSPEDALKIQTSKQLGSLSLLMRAPEDEKSTPTTEIGQNDVDGDRAKNKGTPESDCDGGIVRIEGKEYLLGCNGKITEMDDSFDPYE